MAPTVHWSMHKPQDVHRSTAMAGFSRRQSTSMVMQYFTHFAQQMLSGSKIAPLGQAGMQSLQWVHLSGSITGHDVGSRLLMSAAVSARRGPSYHGSIVVKVGMHILTGRKVHAPQGDLANLEGRVAGENAVLGDVARFPGTIQTDVCRIFDYAAGSTGISDEEAASPSREAWRP
jgi:hypothetical protein